MSKINKTIGKVRRSCNSLVVSLPKNTVKNGDTIEIAYRIYEQDNSLSDNLGKINKTESKTNKTEKKKTSKINKTNNDKWKDCKQYWNNKNYCTLHNCFHKE